MQRLNAMVSPRILNAIQKVVEREGLSGKKLRQAVVELSRRFTKERVSLRQTYLDNWLFTAAYLQYFLPVNFAKIQRLLDEMPIPEATRPVSILDLGSGPGTGALAALDWWQQRQFPHALSVTVIDHSPEALRQTKQLWDRYCEAGNVGEVKVETHAANLEGQTWMGLIKQKAPFSVIILANCLNEIYADTTDPIGMRAGLVSEALSLLDSQGTMIIVEPALRETSRALHQVRDRVLREKRCTVYSPCLHEHACPALINPYDWCHEERVWEPPAEIKEIDEEVGFIKDALKFSYLLLRKDGKTIVKREHDVHRVVSELRQLKGEKRAWLCNEQGRQEIGRQDRLVSTQNEAFDDWHRGAIVQIERIVRKEKAGKVSMLGRIERDAAVKIVRSV